jgi:diguanylate cyclase
MNQPDDAPVPVIPYSSVDEALTELTQCLQAVVPYRAWMVTRVEGGEQIILHASDKLGVMKPGDAFPWTDTFCRRMVEEGAPAFAQDAQSVEAYRTAPVGAAVPVGAYIGQPLKAADGTLMGVLCAIDPRPQEELSPEHQLLVVTLARTMALLLQGRLIVERARQQEALQAYRAETDGLTGLTNRRGWDNALQSEESALKVLGSNAMVLVLDLDGLKKLNDSQGHAAGDQLLQVAGQVLQQQLRDVDVVARLGGDEFALLARGISEDVARKVARRVQDALSLAGVRASVGYAMRREHGTLRAAQEAADLAMYRDKRARKTERD